MNDKFRSGFIAIIGKPNVGKSTLLNSLLDKKIVIVSNKPETTRESVKGILTTKDTQVVFVDTPGIHKPHLLLGKVMVDKAREALFDADLLLFMVELTSGLSDKDHMILDMIKSAGKPAIVVINKIDAAKKAGILKIIDDLKSAYGFLDYIPISALNKDNIILLTNTIKANLPLGDQYYPESQITDRQDEFQVAEIIREKILALTKQEVPHSVAVVIETLSKRDNKDILDIEAMVYVERESQKAIIIGSKGEMMKEIATLSRIELEEKFGVKVFLKTWVKVLKNWRKDPNMLKRLGVC
ncbi:GTPase Era [Candidatus Omnitrophota bacterium]